MKEKTQYIDVQQSSNIDNIWLHLLIVSLSTQQA
jgi:hypothetical protein